MRKLVSIILTLVIVFSLSAAAVSPVSAATGDEMRAARKIISVVYDDSSSMYGDRWAYTSYAMQALIALLNEQDTLLITFMSDPRTVYDVDTSDLPGAVANIRNWLDSGVTPGETLDTARQALDGISESDTSVQFWLVILTDGSITGLMNGLQSQLNSYKGEVMSNGSLLNTAYLAMGEGATQANGDPDGGLHTFFAKDSSEISGTMGEMANLISSRLTADKVTQVNDTTLSFSSALPMYSISVLSQNSPASVVSATFPEGQLTIDRNIALDAYDPFGGSGVTLQGNAAVLCARDASGAGQIIPAGNYTITFSEPVDKKDVVIQYEPAIGLKLTISRSGVDVDDPTTLASGEKVNIEITPVIPGTDTPIASSDLPKNIGWSVDYLVDDTVLHSSDGTKLTDVILQPGDNIVRGTMRIPGFAPAVYEIGFTVAEIIYDFGLEASQPNPLSYNRRTPADGSNEGGGITFTITNEGVPLSADMLDSLGLKPEITSVVCDSSKVTGFLNTFGKTPATCELKQNADGTYSLIPQSVIPFTAFLMQAGDYTVTVCLNLEPGITATGTFTMVPGPQDWIDLWILLLILAVIIYLIYIIFIKYKFANQTIRMEVYKLLGSKGSEMRNRSRSIVLSPLSGGLLLPTRACRKKFNGLILQAGPDGLILITGKSVAKRVKFYGASASDPETSLGAIVSSMRSTEKKEGNRIVRTAPDQTVSTTRAIYFRNSANDTQIWRILQHSKKGKRK